MLSRRHDNTPIVSDKGDDGISPEERKNGQTVHSRVRVYVGVHTYVRMYICMYVRVCLRVRSQWRLST